jgi:hypothetical protein
MTPSSISACLVVCLALLVAVAADCSSVWTRGWTETFEDSARSVFTVDDGTESNCDGDGSGCTYWYGAAVVWNATLPIPYNQRGGLQATLSRTPCQRDVNCLDSHWAGAHMGSSGQCLQYGSMEFEAYVDLPAVTEGVFYLGGYVFGTQNPVSGPGDNTSWNEVHHDG